MATIYDVANAAKVSIASVSLVMNNPNTPRVGAAKRKQILALAGKLGYSPSGLARALSSGTTRILGLVVPMRDPIFFNNFIAEVSCRHSKLRDGSRLSPDDLLAQRQERHESPRAS